MIVIFLINLKLILKAEAESAAAEKKAQLELEAKIKREAAEAEAVRKAEKELQEQLRQEKINKDIEAAVAKKEQEARESFEQAKEQLEESGAEFVSKEEFDKMKSKKEPSDDGKPKNEL